MVVASWFSQFKEMGLCGCSLKAQIYVLFVLNSLFFQKCVSFSYRRNVNSRGIGNNVLENRFNPDISNILLNNDDEVDNRYDNKNFAREYLNLLKSVISEELGTNAYLKQSRFATNSDELPEVLDLEKIRVPSSSWSEGNIGPLYTRLLRVVLEEDVQEPRSSAFSRNKKGMPGMLGLDVIDKTVTALDSQKAKQQETVFALSDRRQPAIVPHRKPNSRLTMSGNISDLRKMMENIG